MEGDKYDVSDDIDDDVAVRRDQSRYSTGLGNDKIPFWLCPLLFVLAVLLGAFSHLWLPIVIVGLLLGRGYRRSF